MLYYSYIIAPTLRTYSELVADVQFRNFAAQWPLGVIIKGCTCDHEKIWGFHLAYRTDVQHRITIFGVDI